MQLSAQLSSTASCASTTHRSVQVTEDEVAQAQARQARPASQRQGARVDDQGLRIIMFM